MNENTFGENFNKERNGQCKTALTKLILPESFVICLVNVGEVWGYKLVILQLLLRN